MPPLLANSTVSPMSREASPRLRFRVPAACSQRRIVVDELADRVRRRPARRCCARPRSPVRSRAIPRPGSSIALRHADVDALGRDPRMVGVGLGNFDVIGHHRRAAARLVRQPDVHQRRRRASPAAIARAEGVHAACGRRDPRRPRPRWRPRRSRRCARDGGGDLVAASLDAAAARHLPADRRPRRRRRSGSSAGPTR